MPTLLAGRARQRHRRGGPHRGLRRAVHAGAGAARLRRRHRRGAAAGAGEGRRVRRGAVLRREIKRRRDEIRRGAEKRPRGYQGWRGG